MPPVLTRLSARSFSALACARLASATSRDAFARSRASVKSVSSRTPISSPRLTRSPSVLSTRSRRAAISGTTVTSERGSSVPVSESVSARSRVCTVAVRTGTLRTVSTADGASASVPEHAVAPAAAITRMNRKVLVCIFAFRFSFFVFRSSLFVFRCSLLERIPAHHEPQGRARVRVGKQGQVADILSLPQRLLCVDNLHLGCRAQLVVGLGHLARPARLGHIELGRLVRAIRERERIDCRLYLELHLILESSNLLRHGVPLRGLLGDTTRRSP